jgi:hypothetical protein
MGVGDERPSVKDGVSKNSVWSHLRESPIHFRVFAHLARSTPHEFAVCSVELSNLPLLLPLQGPSHFSYRFNFFNSLFSSAALLGGSCHARMPERQPEHSLFLAIRQVTRHQ